MYDLLLRGAHVVDPLNGVNGIADVAVADGKIAAVGPGLEGEAREVIDLRHYRQPRASGLDVGFAFRPEDARHERRDDLP